MHTYFFSFFFLGKSIILCILKGSSHFKMHGRVTLNTGIFFIWPKIPSLPHREGLGPGLLVKTGCCIDPLTSPNLIRQVFTWQLAHREGLSH